MISMTSFPKKLLFSGLPVAGESQTFRLLPTPTVAEFVRELIQQQFDRIVRKERGILADKDPEYLHQLRVSYRRLAAGLQVLGTAVKIPKAAGEKRLGGLTKTLGRLRDLDVQIAMISEKYYPQLNLVEKEKLSKLLAILREQRHQVFTKVKAVLHHPSYQELKASYQDWLRDPQYTSIAHLPLSLLLPELLSPALSFLLLHPAWLISLEDRSSEGDQALHNLRKNCKTARYQAELFTSFYGSDFRAWTEELKQLQDILGQVQDARVLRQLIADELGAASLPELEQAIQQDRTESLANWEMLRHNYLDFDFRYYLHQMLLKSCSWELQPEASAEE
jgi:CHAD domain-containing protein